MQHAFQHQTVEAGPPITARARRPHCPTSPEPLKRLLVSMGFLHALAHE